MSSTESARAAHHVVVVGAGFGGIACTDGLARHDVTVTLIDKNSYHQFQPLLYQIATDQIPVDDILRPVEDVFEHRSNVTVLQAEVVNFDPSSRTVTTSEGQQVGGDFLVLATGSLPNYFGIAGAREHTIPLYSATDAIRLRSRIRELVDTAPHMSSSPGGDVLVFVIVGAGATGVETAGALAELLHDVAASNERHGLIETAWRVVVVDEGTEVLGPFSESTHNYAAASLESLGVELLLERRVARVDAELVVLDDGTEIAAQCIVWAGGLTAASIDSSSKLVSERGDRLVVEENLALTGFDGVYAIGDLAYVTGPDDTPYPQLGAVASQAGHAAAASIVAIIDGRPAPSFRYHDKGIMAMIGRNAAVAEFGKQRHELHGPLAFSAWVGVHAWLLGTVRGRVDLFVNWAWSFFTGHTRRPQRGAAQAPHRRTSPKAADDRDVNEPKEHR